MSILRIPHANPLDILCGSKDSLVNMCKAVAPETVENSPVSRQRRIETDGPEVLDMPMVGTLSGDDGTASLTGAAVPGSGVGGGTWMYGDSIHYSCDGVPLYWDSYMSYASSVHSSTAEPTFPSHEYYPPCQTSYHQGPAHDLRYEFIDHSACDDMSLLPTEVQDYRAQHPEVLCERPGCHRPAMTQSRVCFDHYADDLYSEVSQARKGPRPNVTYDPEVFYQHHRPRPYQSLTWRLWNGKFSPGPGDLFYKIYFDGLVQDCSISNANALEILQSCTKPNSPRGTVESCTKPSIFISAWMRKYIP